MITHESPSVSIPLRFMVVPAVDVLGSAAVRLEQGDFSRLHPGARDPEEWIALLAGAGARLLHIVDLDGARGGGLRPKLMARLIACAAGVPVQISGGIRSLEDAGTLLDAGAQRVVLGTAAFSGKTTLERFADALGEHLVVAVDVRAGKVALQGWTRSTEMAVHDAIDQCVNAGVRRILCTAIERDGTLAGPDLALFRRVQARAGIPVIAAGGIRSEADLAGLATMGLEGAVVGRALIDGHLPLSVLDASRVESPRGNS